MIAKTKLNLFDTSMLVMSLVIGMGIFRNPVEVAKQAQTEEIFFAAWLLGGLVSFCGALTYAEIGSRFPVKGGYYKVFSYCYHPAFAFMVNWMIVISNAGATAIVAMVGAEYINPILLPESWQNPTGIKLTSVGTILLLYGINYAGIKLSAQTQNVLSLLKIGLMLLLCLSIFFHDAPQAAAAAAPILSTTDSLKALALSFVPIFFTYGGYQNTINFGTDIQDAPRNTPRGIFIGFALIIFLYLTINYAYVQVLGFGGVQTSTSLTSDLAKVFFGETGYKITSVLLFISVMTFVNSAMLFNPRIHYAMADDGVLPPIFKRTNERTQVQGFALTVFAVFLVLVLLFIDSFRELLNYVMFFDSVGMITSAFTIFLLRRQAQGQALTGVYTIGWGKNIVPAVFIVIYFVTALSALLSTPENLPIALGLFAGGLPLYYLVRYSLRKT